MRPLRLRLKAGADPSDAVTVLSNLINAGRNVIASVGGATLIGPGAVPLADAYVSWVENIELQLAALSFDDELIGPLHTERPNLACVKPVDRFDQVLEPPAQPVQPPHHQRGPRPADSSSRHPVGADASASLSQRRETPAGSPPHRARRVADRDSAPRWTRGRNRRGHGSQAGCSPCDALRSLGRVPGETMRFATQFCDTPPPVEPERPSHRAGVSKTVGCKTAIAGRATGLRRSLSREGEARCGGPGLLQGMSQARQLANGCMQKHARKRPHRRR
jgi:hypothetical protein